VLDGDKLIEQRHRQRTSQPDPAQQRPDAAPAQSDKPLDIYLRLVSEHQLRPAITCNRSDRRRPGQTLIFGLLFGCLAC
jgi:hypothetical protein